MLLRDRARLHRSVSKETIMLNFIYVNIEQFKFLCYNDLDLHLYATCIIFYTQSELCIRLINKFQFRQSVKVRKSATRKNFKIKLHQQSVERNYEDFQRRKSANLQFRATSAVKLANVPHTFSTIGSRNRSRV